MSRTSGRYNDGGQHLTHSVYFTDRGENRRGENQVTFEWLGKLDSGRPSTGQVGWPPCGAELDPHKPLT
ncbi:hypothetical protein ACFT0G_38230 [Streptomyces sp. NPDC057020]|uniref:hypothetical protein n=1 Tax=unclassified Streptomyces TaxID=2593676 RepID=UPI00362592E5